MIEIVQIGDFQVAAVELLPLLRKYQLLPGLLRELIVDRAIVEVECSKEERVAAIQQFYNRYGLTSDDGIQQWLSQQGLNHQQMEEIAVRNFKIEKFKLANWSNKVESYFLKRKGQLDRAIYSLIRTNDIGIAQEIYFRTVDGEQTFAEAASQYSQGVEAQTGGAIGPVELSIPHPIIANLIATQPLGKICPPIKIEQWYAIVRPERLIPAQLNDAMRQRLIDELFQTWLLEQIRVAIATPTSASESMLL